MNHYTHIAAVFGAIIVATLSVMFLPRQALGLITFVGGALAGFEYLSGEEPDTAE